VTVQAMMNGCFSYHNHGHLIPFPEIIREEIQLIRIRVGFLWLIASPRLGFFTLPPQLSYLQLQEKPLRKCEKREKSTKGRKFASRKTISPPQ
jgi:hypothetical protein